MKLKLLKFLDKYLGTFAVSLLPRPVRRKCNLPASFLIIRPGGIGDAVILLPVIRRLKDTFPQASLDVLVEKRNAEIFTMSPCVDKVLLYDNWKHLSVTVFNNYDVVIDTEQWHRLSAVIARLTNAKMLIGFATNKRKKLFSHPITYSHDDFELDSFNNLLRPLNFKKQRKIDVPYLEIPRETDARATKLLAPLNNRPFVAIFPGASVPEKRWGIDNFIKLASVLHQKEIPFAVLGSKSDLAQAEFILRGTSGLNLAGKTSLVETSSVISKSRALVSGDSGLLHIASALGKPTVSLFGPSSVKKWAPKGTSHVVICMALPCSPCSKFGYTPKCPLDAKCMADISFEEVERAVVKLFCRLGECAA